MALKPEPSLVQSVLTLRYYPSSTSTFSKLSWSDFSPTNASPSIDHIEKMMKKEITDKVQNDETISVALSGGVDSTLVASILRKTVPNEIQSISIKFSESVDETPQAILTAEHLGIKPHIVHVENYLAELPKAISIIKMPFWDLHWYYVTKKAQTLSKYLVAGDGGDEIFGGYTFRYKKFLSLTNNGSNPQEKVRAYLECHERDNVPDQEKLFGKKTGFSWEFIYDLLLPYFDNKLPLVDQVFLADFNGKLLYNFIPINTALHNRFGLTAVAPILTKDMVDYVTHIPNNLKYDHDSDIGKILLRKLLSKYDMDKFVSKEKLGFNVNTLNLWKNFGQKLCKKYLVDSRIVQDEWINSEWINTYIDKNDLNVRYVNKFLGLLALEIWYRLFITKEMNDETLLN